MTVMASPSTTATLAIRADTPTPTPQLPTHVPAFHADISATPIGLLCELGGCAVLGMVVWLILYFRVKPLSNLSAILTVARKAAQEAEAATRTEGKKEEQKKKKKNKKGFMLRERLDRERVVKDAVTHR